RRWQILAVLLAAAATYGADKALDYGAAWAVEFKVLTQITINRLWNAREVAGLHWPVWALIGLIVAVAFLLLRRRARPVNWPAVTCGFIGLGLCSLVVILA